jgi:hypothetical protein
MDPNRAEILGVRVCRIPPKWFHFPESLAKLIGASKALLKGFGENECARGGKYNS